MATTISGVIQGLGDRTLNADNVKALANKVREVVKVQGPVTGDQIKATMAELAKEEGNKSVVQTFIGNFTQTLAEAGAEIQKFFTEKADQLAEAINELKKPADTKSAKLKLAGSLEVEIEPAEKIRTEKVEVEKDYKLQDFSMLTEGVVTVEKIKNKNAVKVTVPADYKGKKRLSFNLPVKVKVQKKVGGKDQEVEETKNLRLDVKLGTKEAGAAGDNAAQETKTDSFSAKPIKKDESTSEFTLPDGAKIEDGLNKDGKTADGKFQIETSDGGKKFKLKATEDVKENTNAEVKYKDAQGVQTAKVAFKTPQEASVAADGKKDWWKSWGGWVLPGLIGAVVWLGTLVLGGNDKKGQGILGGIATFIAGLAIGGKFEFFQNLVGGKAE